MRQVAVVVTVKNSVGTIKKCIDSLLAQTYSCKVYVIDAFSTDGTWEVIKSYGKKVKTYQLEGNPPKAYNWVLEKIKENLVVFTDADCEANKNWARELVRGFNEGVLAVAGFCDTPRKSNFLQRLIGKELEARFKKFPKFVQRAPTMNLAVLADTLRELKFDEGLDVAYDTDFGYRLNKKGKMLYNPKAVIHHHHRASLKGYFRQQMTYGKFSIGLYLKNKGKGVTGDNVSTGNMLLQELLFVLVIASLLAAPVTKLFAAVSIAMLSIIYLINGLKITKNPLEIVAYFGLFFIRNLAWTVGVIIGFLKYLKS